MFDSFLFSRVGEGNALPSWATRPSSRVPSGRLNADCQNKRGAVETTESEIRVNPQQPGVVVVRFQIALHWAAFERQNDQQTEHAPSDAKRSVPNVVVAGHGGGGGGGGGSPVPRRHCHRGHGDRGDISQCTHVLPACRLQRGRGLRSARHARRSTQCARSSDLLVLHSCFRLGLLVHLRPC
jgi:hypothetical protein